MSEKDLSIRTLLEILDSLAPFSLSATWDNTGLMLGDPERRVSGVLIALDPNENLLDEALAHGLDTIITHHPLIFHPIKNIHSGSPLGRMLKKALNHDLSLIACHTNLDLAQGGVNQTLAAKLGLTMTRPLSGREDAPDFGRLGELPAPLPGDEFVAHLLASLSLDAIQLAGPIPETVRLVALCGGSGSELAEKAREAGAQVFVTGEVKHSTARWAEACGFSIFDAGHYPTEAPVLEPFAESLKKACRARGFNPAITVSNEQKKPMRWLAAP